MSARPFAASCLLLALAAACDTAPRTPDEDDTGARGAPDFVVQDGLEYGLVRRDSIVTPSTPDRPMSVVQKVRNVTDDALNVQYRIVFYDALGRELRSNMGWRYRQLEPRLETELDACALDSAAKSWRIIVRSNK